MTRDVMTRIWILALESKLTDSEMIHEKKIKKDPVKELMKTEWLFTNSILWKIRGIYWS